MIPDLLPTLDCLAKIPIQKRKSLLLQKGVCCRHEMKDDNYISMKVESTLQKEKMKYLLYKRTI